MASNVYQPITLSVASANPQAGDRITVTLSKRGGKNVAWSTGESFAASAGITLLTTSNTAVPVSRFAITSSVVTFILAPSDSGSGSSFDTKAFLVAASDISQFNLTLTTNAGSTVSATLPGRIPVPLTETPTSFDWNPEA